MDKSLKNEVGRLLHWLKSTEMRPEQQLQTFFYLGVSSTAARLKSTWLGSAPAHPERLHSWLESKLDRSVQRLWDEQSNQLLDFNLTSLTRLGRSLIAVSQPDQWSALASRSVPHWRVRLTGDVEKLLMLNRELADFLSETSSTTVKSLQIVAAAGRKKALAAQHLKWNWPLTISLADEDTELRSILKTAAPTAAYQFEPFDRHTSASLLFVSGNVKEAARRLDSFVPDRFAYVVVTGIANNVLDLIVLAQKHNLAGVVALGLGDDTEVRAHSFDRLFRSLEHGAPLDAAVQVGGHTICPVVFGHPLALQRTTISYDLDRLMSNVSLKAEDAEIRVQNGVASLGLQVGAYKPRVVLDRLQYRPRALDRDEFASLVALVSEIKGQLHDLPDRLPPKLSVEPRSEPVDTAINRDRVNEGESYDSDEYAYGRAIVNPPYGLTLPSDDRGELLPTTTDAAKTARVQAVLSANGRQVHSLHTDQDAAVRIWISPIVSERAVYANRDFPLDRLGPESSHDLHVAFVPLKGTPHRGKAQLQSRTFVMSTGELPPVDFKIVTDSDSDEYRARVLIIHRNRVVQSILLTVAICEMPLTARSLQLVVENDVKPDLSYLRKGSSFDLSLVLNHNDEDQAGVIAVRPNRVSFREPQGDFQTSLDSIKTILWSLNSTGEPFEKHDSQHLEGKLRDLARHGNILRDALFGAEPDLEVFTAPKVYKPEHPLRLQVVEARAGSYLPVEFFYDFAAPSNDARLCAKYRLGDFPTATCTGCQDRGNKNVICPVGFWGVSRVIERRPKDASLPMGASYECSEPLGDRQQLKLTRQALLGSSDKVKPEDENEISGILARRGKAPLQANCWTTWGSHIKDHGPSLLVAIAHTEMDLNNDILSLEIRNSQLLVCDIESELVKRQKEENPVVVLLGCQTKFADEPLQSAAARFKRKGAALVISTIATMRGRQAPACVAVLVDEIDNARNMSSYEKRQGKASAGMVMLRTKQKLIGSGHAIGMCLTANGDAEWYF